MDERYQLIERLAEVLGRYVEEERGYQVDDIQRLHEAEKVLEEAKGFLSTALPEPE